MSKLDWALLIVTALVAISGYGIQDIAASSHPSTAEQEHRYWYQWYFHTERGRAGLTHNRRGLCRLLHASVSRRVAARARCPVLVVRPLCVPDALVMEAVALAH